MNPVLKVFTVGILITISVLSLLLIRLRMGGGGGGGGSDDFQRIEDIETLTAYIDQRFNMFEEFLTDHKESVDELIATNSDTMSLLADKIKEWKCT